MSLLEYNKFEINWRVIEMLARMHRSEETQRLVSAEVVHGWLNELGLWDGEKPITVDARNFRVLTLEQLNLLCDAMNAVWGFGHHMQKSDPEGFELKLLKTLADGFGLLFYGQDDSWWVSRRSAMFTDGLPDFHAEQINEPSERWPEGKRAIYFRYGIMKPTDGTWFKGDMLIDRPPIRKQLSLLHAELTELTTAWRHSQPIKRCLVYEDDKPACQFTPRVQRIMRLAREIGEGMQLIEEEGLLKLKREERQLRVLCVQMAFSLFCRIAYGSSNMHFKSRNELIEWVLDNLVISTAGYLMVGSAIRNTLSLTSASIAHYDLTTWTNLVLVPCMEPNNPLVCITSPNYFAMVGQSPGYLNPEPDTSCVEWWDDTESTAE